ncbi:hypothetical protein MKQ70_21225 [Chitinophaga sedimenti]|uniref:hypothetical protein n=1 Tax=Chitinophaga sedimenti TaxID=2033606 RepID=UPI002003BECA|nr:hypothetical protein [Chitinophaga sedimenti]MCK7557385.1 hypothetical protein [Chitinophaga sedimenti]
MLMACLVWTGILYAQEELQQEIQAAMELQAEEGVPVEDDAQWQLLQSYLKHPLDLNRADEGDLQAMGVYDAVAGHVVPAV